MNDRTPCATPEALITYVYDECEPAERTSITSHVAMCPLCAEEVRALSDTRAHMASWSPPALPLGFQITRTGSDQSAKVLDFGAAVAPEPRSGEGGWWRRPLPAWAQMAAAVVIFAAGMSVSAFRSSDEQPTRVDAAPATWPVAERADTRTDDLSVTRGEFARLEARLRAMEHADVSRASYVPGNIDGEDLRAQLSALASRVAANERQNSKDFRETALALNALQDNLQDSRQTAQKVNQLEAEVQDHRHVLRTAVAPDIVQRVTFTSGLR